MMLFSRWTLTLPSLFLYLCYNLVHSAPTAEKNSLSTYNGVAVDSGFSKIVDDLSEEPVELRGVGKPLCNMFGCGGNDPPPTSRCSDGFKYDRRRKKCARLV